jgi:ribonuclease Z
MRPIFQAELVNPAFGDPGVYIDLKFLRRALLFDTGDVVALSTRKLLRVSDVFVSHTHMDHFAGFDHFLRVCLGRSTGVRIYGPERFIDQLEHKLAAYTWNLVENYETDFVIVAHELESGRLKRAAFSSRRRFERETLEELEAPDGLLLDDEQFKVRARAFDHHGVSSLAFRFEEAVHMNVWKNRLEELGLPTGPWLTDLKRKVRAGEPDDTPMVVRWRTRGGSREKALPLGELRQRVLEFAPGQRVCYVTDVAGHDANMRGLIDFLDSADLVFIEATFLHVDREHAERKAHLTARLAGSIVRAARVRTAIPFHFSTRYMGRESEIASEFEMARREG